jgi:nitrite reductase/ring-hydroxylating ferredoxin subunit
MSTDERQTRSRLDPDPVPRRDFLGMASALWTMGTPRLRRSGCSVCRARRWYPAPSKKFKVTCRSPLADGQAFFPPGRNVVVFRDAAGIYAISRICTHLGCIVKRNAGGFSCPCHGSQFAATARWRRGRRRRRCPGSRSKREGASVIIDEGAVVPPGTKARREANVSERSGHAPSDRFVDNLRAVPGNLRESLVRGARRRPTARGRASSSGTSFCTFTPRARTAGASWSTTLGLGIMSTAAFLITLITGVLLMFYYKPYPDVAYDSIKDIHFVVPTGRFIRNIHRWAANVMVVAVFST